MNHVITVESELAYGGNGEYFAMASGGGEQCFKQDASEGRARNIARANLIALLGRKDMLSKKPSE